MEKTKKLEFWLFKDFTGDFCKIKLICTNAGDKLWYQNPKCHQRLLSVANSHLSPTSLVFPLKLHFRQCLPFMLRRQKSDVLADLPPKIIQDYCCELSPLQKMLYEDFAKSRAKKSIESGLEDISKADEKAEKISHIFQVSIPLCSRPQWASHPS